MSTLESLPNEVILTIFDYLSSIDLCQTFFDFPNMRFRCLLLAKRHVFVTSSLRFTVMSILLDPMNDLLMRRFMSLIDTLVLDDSLASMMFVDYFQIKLRENPSFDIWHQSIRQLVVLNADRPMYDIVRPLMSSLTMGNGSLRRMHLVFEHTDGVYWGVLRDLASYRVSVHTMVLDVKRGRSWTSFQDCRAADRTSSDRLLFF